MSHRRHHTIIVTVPSDDVITDIRDNAIKIFGEYRVSAIYRGANFYKTVFIVPDGLSETQEASAEQDKNRTTFIQLLQTMSVLDSRIDYVEVMFGDENSPAAIVNQSNDYLCNDKSTPFGVY